MTSGQVLTGCGVDYGHGGGLAWRTVGAQLLDRSGRSVRLTDAGTTYVHYARGALRDLAGRRLALLSGDFATRGHVDALTEIVRRTSLATVLPDAVTRDHPRLRPVPLDPALPARTVTLLRREGAYESAAVRAFTELTGRLVRSRGYRPA